MKKLICCLLLSTFAAFATELTGKWSGSFDITNSEGETKPDNAYMDFKEHNGEVTGTAGPDIDKQWPIQKGKLDGQKLTFEVATDDGGQLVCDLVFDGDAVKGKCTGTGNSGEKMSAQLALKRTQ